jgi:hypothetical protein
MLTQTEVVLGPVRLGASRVLTSKKEIAPGFWPHGLRCEELWTICAYMRYH